MFLCKYMDQNGSAAMLAIKRSTSVTPEVNLLCADDEACKRVNAPWLQNLVQMLAVQNKGISVPHKKNCKNTKITSVGSVEFFVSGR